jgi:hypothetical protein
MRNGVVHQATPDFFHGHTFEFERDRTAGFGFEPDPRTAPERLGAESRYVDKKKAAVNGRGWLGRNLREVSRFLHF